MLFHDAYLFMGDRSASRVSLGLWQLPWNGPFTFAAELALAYASYRLWLSGRELAGKDRAVSRKGTNGVSTNGVTEDSRAGYTIISTTYVSNNHNHSMIVPFPLQTCLLVSR